MEGEDPIDNGGPEEDEEEGEGGEEGEEDEDLIQEEGEAPLEEGQQDLGPQEGEEQPLEMQQDEADEFPPYANEQNKELHSIIQEKRALNDQYQNEIEDISERVKILDRHLNSVQQELVHTQKLVDQKNKEIESEDHLKQMAERQSGRLYVEIQKLEQKSLELQDRLNSIQNQIFIGNEKMDKFKLEMNWNQEELEQWALASRQKEEDNLTLEKYRRADEAKIKELTLQIEKLTIQIKALQESLDKEVTETQAKQIELDKTAEEFKKRHQERHELYMQWQQAVDATHLRDQMIQQQGEKFALEKMQLNDQKQKLAEKKQMLENEVSNNKKKELDIGQLERILAKQRLDLLNQNQMNENFKNEVNILRHQLSAFASDLANKRIQVTNLAKGLEDKKQRNEQEEKHYEHTRIKLETEIKNMTNLEQQAKNAEKIFKEQDLEFKKQEKKIHEMKQNLFKHTQELFELREKEATLIGEISSILAQGRNLDANVKKKDTDIQRQKELKYNLDFQIQLMERRVSKAEGEQTIEEMTHYKNMNEQLKSQAKDLKENYRALTKSLRQLEDDLRGVDRHITKQTLEKKMLEDVIGELMLENDMTERENDLLVKKAEETLVQHDIMKLEVKKLKEALGKKADEVYTLENKKYQLEMSMEEREKEIQVHKDVLAAEKRAVDEEKHKVTVELADRFSKVNNLKAKYEGLCAKNVAREDGEVKPQAYYVIKAAQEREELQKKGDELDAKIRKSEREIQALMNTLDHLKNRNTNERTKYVKGTDNKEKEQKGYMEEQCRGASAQLFRKKKELQRLQKEYQDETRRLIEVNAKCDALSRQIHELTTEKEKVDRDVQIQNDKLQRSTQKLQSTESKLQGQLPEGQQAERINKEIEQLRFQYLTSAISMLVQEYPEMSQVLEVPLHEAGIRLPSRAPSEISEASSIR